MTSPLALLALLALLAGCSVPSAEAGSDSVKSTAYSCAGIASAHQVADVDPDVVGPWRAFARDPILDGTWVARVRAQTNVRLPVLGTEARVRLQHELLIVAERLDRRRRDHPEWKAWANAHAAVVDLIQRVAPRADELVALGDGAHPRVASILGPTAGITERATRTCAGGNSVHAAHAGGKLAYRPLRAGDTRALVAQIVAFDADGNPHITPLVDGIELRLGDSTSAPACVVEAGADGVLRPVALAELHAHPPFVVRTGDGVGCVGCHRNANAMGARDIAGAELVKVDSARDAQVQALATGLWSRLVAR